jgi:hypothetical protein
MALGLVAKGLMGAGKAASGAKMAKNMFKRKGGKDAPDVPASEQTIDVKAETVQPITPLVPTINPIDATGISKATSPTGTEDLVGTAFRVKTTLVDVDTLLRGSFALDKIRESERRKKESKKGIKKQEKELESATKKNNSKFGLGRLVPTKAKSIFGNIINFFVTLLLGKLALSLLDNIPLFEKIAQTIAAVGKFIVDWGGKLFNALVSFIDFSYNMYDGLRNNVGNLFGESGLKVFDGISGALNKVMNLTIGLTLAMIAFSNEFGSSLVNWGKGFLSIFKRGLARAVPRLLIKMFGKKVAASILGKSVVASTVAGGTTTAATTAAATTTGTSTAATAGGVGAGAAAGIVAGVGLLASGLGEAAFQLTKIGDGFVDHWRKSYKEKKWFDPRKAIDFGIFKIMQTLNLGLGNLGVLLDIVGAPFRYLIELVRYPFLDEAGKAKQRENLAKFDARIREQFRETVNFFTLGLAFKEKGSFGSIYGKEGTEKMGYTETDEVTNKKADEVLSIINNNVSSEGLETYPSYDEAGGGTTTYIVSQKGSSGGEETSTGTNAEVTKMSEGLILSGSGSESNNSYDVLAKR